MPSWVQYLNLKSMVWKTMNNNEQNLGIQQSIWVHLHHVLTVQCSVQLCSTIGSKWITSSSQDLGCLMFTKSLGVFLNIVYPSVFSNHGFWCLLLALRLGVNGFNPPKKNLGFPAESSLQDLKMRRCFFFPEQIGVERRPNSSTSY